MVTNYPQQLTAATEVSAGGDRKRVRAEGGILDRMIVRVGQFVCGLSGHDSVLHVEGNRIMMRCTSCGHDTPGWEISGNAPRLRYEGDSRRHLLVTKPQLVLRKSA